MASVSTQSWGVSGERRTQAGKAEREALEPGPGAIEA
jgi:hypothetical protein